MKKKNVLIGGALLAAGAVVMWNTRRTIPKRAVAVAPFDVDLFLGKWYEMARLDHRFERTKRNNTITYSRNADGSIRVVNRGYDYSKRKRVINIGKAKFVGSAEEAKMKISYFKLLSFGYNVIAIDPEYKYALVAGEDLHHLWLLSREPDIPEEIKQAFLRKALIIGYDITKLVWVEHSQLMGGQYLSDEEYTQIDQDLV
ncbi:lipocalin [Parabacteroides sp. 52]|uniref:lipocalin family protein n=1 Tax=unclassified Parabacteroides TaxID=2649774 RepID=UPI0013D14014|nr:MULTISPECIES: lipocalin family protein [unclassified Parabacteroides]MDH6535164.1 apolipoprotein D and lipocalin family protein [Parabacteroides sp. PM5-20]NDV56204.1 lipocalin [Parabacteroides sp. 52]